VDNYVNANEQKGFKPNASSAVLYIDACNSSYTPESKYKESGVVGPSLIATVRMVGMRN